MDLGKNLYNLRKNKNLSQEEVAEKLNVTRQTISKWETNESKPDFDKILPICELFNITTEELLIGINTEKQELNETINNKNTDSEIIKKRAIFISIGTFLYFLSLALIICTEEINNQNLNIKTISGDVSVQKAENAKIETTSGDIEINEVNRLNAKSVSGEIIIKFLKSKCNLKTTSGDIEIDNLELLDDSDITSISGDIEINKNLGAYIKTETLSGEVNVENNDRYAKNELKIKTTSGDIEVEN